MHARTYDARVHAICCASIDIAAHAHVAIRTVALLLRVVALVHAAPVAGVAWRVPDLYVACMHGLCRRPAPNSAAPG
jgi:hypothetical protein